MHDESESVEKESVKKKKKDVGWKGNGGANEMEMR